MKKAEVNMILHAKNYRQPLEAIKYREQILPLEPPEETLSYQLLDSSPERPISNFWPPEL